MSRGNSEKIGRAALGNPWIFREVRQALLHGRVAAPPTVDERLHVAAEHAHLLALQTHGAADSSRWTGRYGWEVVATRRGIFSLFRRAA